MNISLTPELEGMVRQKVKEGRYLSASEVVRDALRLLDESDRMRQLRLDALRKEISIGLEQLDRGEGAPLSAEEIKAAGRKKLAHSRKERR
jgi:antitoxin ParD1/3/4